MYTHLLIISASGLSFKHTWIIQHNSTYNTIKVVYFLFFFIFNLTFNYKIFKFNCFFLFLFMRLYFLFKYLFEIYLFVCFVFWLLMISELKSYQITTDFDGNNNGRIPISWFENSWNKNDRLYLFMRVCATADCAAVELSLHSKSHW